MLKPASLFTDGAVLCRGREIRVFGEADPGNAVRVTLTDRAGSLLAETVCESSGGRFLAVLPPQQARTCCRLTVSAGTQQVSAEDIAIGEVFLAGGQSNMELELRSAAEGPEIIRDYSDPLLRFFNVPKIAVSGPDHRKANDAARWHAVSPGQGGENSAVAYFFAARLRQRLPGIPVGIIGCYWGGTSITCWMEEETLRTSPEGTRYLDEYAALTGGKTMETWQQEETRFEETFSAWSRTVEQYQQQHSGAPWEETEKACGPAPWYPPAGPGSPYRPAGLAVTMVREIIPVSLTGILFYQGEEDAAKTVHYDELLALLIRSWRKAFLDPDLPFLFVQLPMWIALNAEDSFLWAALRKAQAAVRDSVPSCGMICLLDQGEYGNVHPVAKRPVGERLAELAGSMLYGGGECSPRAEGLRREGSSLVIPLSAPVEVRGGGAPALMEIAGEDGFFVPAEAEIRGTELVLRSGLISCPLHARYAWTDYSDRVNLFGRNGLPLEPFDL